MNELNPYTGTSQATYIDFNTIYNNNIADANGIGDPSSSTNYVIRASMNNHNWYGIVSNLKTKLNENLSLNLGLDLRTYSGTHYRQVADYLGLKGWRESRPLRGGNDLLTSTTVFNTVNEYYPAEPWTATVNNIGESQRIDYDYSETISYGGVFGQLEYSKDNLSAFFQGSVSNQSHQRFDRYDYLPEFKDSDKVNNIGYNAKAGGSYKIASNHSVYVNAGYYNRQPYHDNVYLNFTNAINPNTSNEKILGLEAGYNYKSKWFNASFNAYRTAWKDRVSQGSRTVTNNTDIAPLNSIILFRDENVEQIHNGLELDFTAKPLTKLSINGFASIGDWQYKATSIRTETDESLNVLRVTETNVDGGKVGDAAQTTWGLGAKYEIFTRFSIDADWRNYEKLYSNVGAVKNNLELPAYDLVDAGISYKMLVGINKKDSVVFRININNVFDEIYLSELTSNIKTTDNISSTNAALGTYQSNNRVYNGIADGNQGYFGFGRTWNVSLRYNF